MKIERVVGVRPEEPVEHQPGMPAGCAGAVFIPRPFAVDVDEVITSSGIGPSALHGFERRTGDVEHRQHCARHPCRIKLVHDGLYGVYRTDLITMYAADEGDALTRLRASDDDDRHIPGLPRRHLHALEKEHVLHAALQVVDVERTDDLLPLDHVPGIDSTPWCGRRLAGSSRIRFLGIRGGGLCRQGG